MLWESTRNKITKKIIIYFIWEAGRLTEYQKGVLGFNEKKKGEKFWLAVSYRWQKLLASSFATWK